MNIENEIFKRYNVDFKKLVKYGFKKENDNYTYCHSFLNNEFTAIININNKGIIDGKVIDNEINEEYVGLRVNINGEFVNKVRDAYRDILINIRDNCFEHDYFIFNQSNRITKYVKEKYLVNPEFLWDKFPGYGVFRNQNNNKWFGIIMNIDLSKISDKSGEVEIINVKVETDKIKKLIEKKGFYKAYHMGKSDWISILLDDTLRDSEIINLIDESYNLISESEYWIVPANPNYYDIVNCFNEKDEIIWKQSTSINVNDIIFLYVTKPYAKIMYKCKVIETNIPYEYSDKNISMNYVMKIKLIKRLENNNYTLEYLNNLGIKTIRGPRKINKNISNKLK